MTHCWPKWHKHTQTHIHTVFIPQPLSNTNSTFSVTLQTSNIHGFWQEGQQIPLFNLFAQYCITPYSGNTSAIDGFSITWTISRESWRNVHILIGMSPFALLFTQRTPGDNKAEGVFQHLPVRDYLPGNWTTIQILFQACDMQVQSFILTVAIPLLSLSTSLNQINNTFTNGMKQWHKIIPYPLWSLQTFVSC